MNEIDGSAYFSGVIEGFYGKPWSWDARTAYADFLISCGMNSYIYAPKADAFLRKKWSTPWPKEDFNQLKSLSFIYKQKGLNFGIGLSPFEIYQQFDEVAKNKLKIKLAEIESLEPNTLCLLFDDMNGDVKNLAAKQIEICHFVADNIGVENFIMCPTYYSFDPILAKVFGEMPIRYWDELGAGLDKRWDIFWTGDKVLSKVYSPESLNSIASKLGRNPVIWDNYPVNDGEKISNFLHLSSVDRNSHIACGSRGLLCNPMNQAELSKAVLSSTASQLLSNAETNLGELLIELYGGEVAKCLIIDRDSFENIGLNGLPEEQKFLLKEKYASIEHDCAQEVSAWLDGFYQFDPACLTD